MVQTDYLDQVFFLELLNYQWSFAIDKDRVAMWFVVNGAGDVAVTDQNRGIFVSRRFAYYVYTQIKTSVGLVLRYFMKKNRAAVYDIVGVIRQPVFVIAERIILLKFEQRIARYFARASFVALDQHIMRPLAAHLTVVLDSDNRKEKGNR